MKYLVVALVLILIVVFYFRNNSPDVSFYEEPTVRYIDTEDSADEGTSWTDVPANAKL